MGEKIEMYADCLSRYGYSATFPITAATLKRHPELISSFQKLGLEFSIHGYTHTDYSRLNETRQKEDMEKAKEIFQNCGIDVYGFRSPYLSWNEDTMKVIKNNDFLYDSNEAIFWDVIDDEMVEGSASMNLASQLYKPKDARKEQSLPYIDDELVRIPVCMPDDEIITERLNLNEEKQISKMWMNMLSQSHKRGELFVLELHPERIEKCINSLENVLRDAKEKKDIWVAQLVEIAKWWKEREKFDISIVREGSWKVNVVCTERATILLKSGKAKGWDGGYEILNDRSFIVSTSKNPSIGVSSNIPEEICKFLKIEGFNVEESTDRSKYEFYLDDISYTEGTSVIDWALYKEQW